ncbi:MAG: transposase [Actinobacteria bacterium]|nr:transposase [Actinomycetota bacterium]MCL4417231.1 transposase [Actinomycetota bacterium]
MNTKRIDYFVYTQNKSQVEKELRQGNIDNAAFSSIGFVDEFFSYLLSSDFFPFCEATYPSPRVKKEVEPWFLLASLIGAKMLGEKSFRNIPYVLRNGTLLKLFGFNIGPGFNNKNKKDRIFPVDQDTIRKYFKDTNPNKLTLWFNNDFTSWLSKKKAYNSGIFILDATFIPLPDNTNYENASYVRLDSSGNYADETCPDAKLTLCYKLSSLLNTDMEASYYIYAAARLDTGSVNGLYEGRDLVQNFIENKGYISTLLIDRGYLDGEMLTDFKARHKINWIIPLKKSMSVYDDAVGLSRARNAKWQLYKTEQNSEGFTTLKEEVVTFDNIKSWEQLSVPVCVSVKRTTDYIEGTVSYFVLAHTKKYTSSSEPFNLYEKRTKIEERHRQLKGWWSLASFTSTSFSLVLTQVLSTLATYSLMQLYLISSEMQDLARRTIDTILKREKRGRHIVICYSGKNYAVFDIDEYSFIIMDLAPAYKERLKKKIRLWNKDPP